MNKLILCEGKTDAILLSYYLGRAYGWKPANKQDRKLLKNLDIRVTNSNQNADWYRKNEDFLLICAVGGKDNCGFLYDFCEIYSTKCRKIHKFKSIRA